MFINIEDWYDPYTSWYFDYYGSSDIETFEDQPCGTTTFVGSNPVASLIVSWDDPLQIHNIRNDLLNSFEVVCSMVSGGKGLFSNIFKASPATSLSTDSKIYNSSDLSAEMEGLSLFSNYSLRVEHMPWSYYPSSPITTSVKVDTGSGILQADIQITIVNPKPAKVEIAADQSTTVLADALSYDISGFFHDYLGRDMIWGVTKTDGSPLPGWITFIEDSKIITASAGALQSEVVLVRVITDDLKMANQTFTIRIINNDPVAITSTTFQETVYEGVTIDHTVDLSTLFNPEADPNQSLSFITMYVPSWLSQTQTGSSVRFQGTAPHSAIGNHKIRVIADDNYDQTVNNFTFIVVENYPPVAPSSFPTTINAIQSQLKMVTLPEFTDAEGDVITYSMFFNDGTAINSSWITFDPSSRTITCVPHDLLTSPVELVLTVKDEANDAFNTSIFLHINFSPKDNPAIVERTK